MASKAIRNITEAAERLYDIRKMIGEKEEANKAELEAMKAERDAVQAVLIGSLNKEGLSSIKVKSGDTFSKGIRKGLEVVNELSAFKWALEHKAVSINKILVAQQLKDAKDIPECFREIETEFISVRKANKKPDEKI